MSDILDSRNLLDELKTLDKIDDIERIAAIEELIEEVGKEDFEFGVTFIRENFWVEYCEDFAYECGYLSSPYGASDTNPLWYHIDWESWADSMSQDYDQIKFDGDTYYWRS